VREEKLSIERRGHKGRERRYMHFSLLGWAIVPLKHLKK
jgi:hypothetical protein